MSPWVTAWRWRLVSSILGTALSSAREKYAAALQAAEDKDHEAALRLANEAEVDARLALAQTERGKSEASLKEINAGLDKLRREASAFQEDL